MYITKADVEAAIGENETTCYGKYGTVANAQDKKRKARNRFRAEIRSKLGLSTKK